MAYKQIQGRIMHKHDTAENWAKAAGFIPMDGEIIIYDADADYEYARIKVGDGVSNVNSLAFVNDVITNVEIDEICGNSISSG